MKLSIIILSHNGWLQTKLCLQSLIHLLDARDDIDVHVIDNGSTDGTLKSLNAVDAFRNKPIEFHRLEQNRGVAGGRNFGIRNSGESEYVMFLDNDTIVTPSSIIRLIEFMDNNPEIGLAAPALKGVNGKLQQSFKKFPGVKEKFLNLIGRKTDCDLENPGKILEPFYVIGACQIIRRSVIGKTGYLDENIFFGPEDADFCIRVRQAGYKVVYNPEIELIHCWQRKSHRRPFSRISRAHIKGLLYFYKKWKRWF